MIFLGTKNLFLLVLLVVFAAVPAWATTWHVPADFDSVCTAIDTALDGDTILISPGTYPGPFSLNKDLTLIGDSQGPGSVILEVSNFWIGPPTLAQLEGLTFSGGNSLNIGAVTGTVHFSDCIFENFQMEDTWGITFFHTEAEFHRCLVRNNHNYASMFWVSNSGNVAFYECDFLNNSGMMGGAITNGGNGFLFIKECFFFQNHTTGRGGAVFGAGPVGIENSLFENNSAEGQGGAVYHEEGNILNCTFIGNSASHGGALAMDQGCDIYIENTDFSSNSASVAGLQGYTVSLGLVNMVCCQANLGLWEGSGQVTLDNEGCIVATQKLSLEAIKAMFR